MNRKQDLAAEAYNLLKDIPEDEWCEDEFSIPVLRRCCAIGHWQRLHSSDPTDYSVKNCADTGYYGKVTSEMRIHFPEIAIINNKHGRDGVLDLLKNQMA